VGTCRQLQFYGTVHGKRLKNHLIRTVDVTGERPCRTLCYMEPNCVSYNFNKVTRKCELNNSTLSERGGRMETNPDYVYCEAENGCANKPCKNKATCQTGFTGKGYRCLCPAEFDGDHCENGKLLKIMDNLDSPPFFQVSCKIRWNNISCPRSCGSNSELRNADIDECAINTHKCGANAICNNTKGGYNCTCHPGYYRDGTNCEPVIDATNQLDVRLMTRTLKHLRISIDNLPSFIL
ncbi:unnamed protein product, partial [Porites evermanni]